MYQKTLDDLVYMSVTSGKRVDYVQAGGGNTSAKFDDGFMAIKASGYLLKEMTNSKAFVVVNGAEMNKYHHEDHPAGVDCNKEATEIAMSTIKQVNGEKPARPSVEVGFHSVLDKFVLHLHPVYVNVLMCSKGGVEKALEIVKKAGLHATFVPYSMPGYDLTKLILDAVDGYEKANGVKPQVIFLKNHGVTTTAETAQEALELMDKVNDSIREALNLPEFPTPAIEPCEGGFKSACAWLKDVMKDNSLAEAVRYEPVYPDQLVYTANEMSIDGSGDGKIAIVGGDMIYKAGEKEAMALEETMVALFYVYYNIKKCGFEYERLSEAECAKVLGWDSEKYRKSLMAEAE